MSEEPVLTTIEKPSPPETVNFTDKHLEAAFAFRTAYHRDRILKAFGEDNKLPPIPKGSADARILEADKRFKKSYDLLRREQPLEIPETNGEVTRDYLIAIADNLAWKGIENSVITEYLDDGEEVLHQLKRNGKSSFGSVIELERAERALKTVLIEDNHFYRDFFDSEVAAALGVDSPKYIEKFIRKASLSAHSSEIAATVAKGASLEIAARRYLDSLLSKDGDEVIVGFGSSEEDRDGGDIVVVGDSSIVYIDIKNRKPDGLGSDEAQEGFRLHFDSKKYVYKAIVWPETRDVVAHDSFRLTDVALKNALQKVMAVTR